MKIVTTIFWALIAASLWFAPAAFAGGNCASEVQACMNEALDGYAQCTEACNIYDGDRWNTCTDRCEAKTRRYETACAAKATCGVTPIDRSSDAATDLPPRPVKAAGNGCYLGECPTDVEVSAAPRSTPAGQPYDGLEQQQPQVQYSWLCQTPQHWCMMNQSPQALPVGSTCYCMNPIYGYANGMVVPQQ